MTAPFESDEPRVPADVPLLLPSRPAVPPAHAPFPPPSRPAVPPAHAPPPPPAAPGTAPAPAREPPSLPSLPPSAPTPPAPPPPADPSGPALPSAVPPAPSPAAEPAFDARAMVESQKRRNPNPSYGEMPKGTAESREAAAKLRREANRKRRRNKTIARIVALVFLAIVVAAGYLAYRSFQDEQDQRRAELEERATADTPSDGGALTPLGEQEQIIEALDDVNSGASPSAGGLLDAVDQARDVVGQTNGDPPDAADAPAPARAPSFDAFLPPAVLAHAEQLDPVDGFERFYVTGPDLAVADPAAWQRLVDQLLAAPQVAPDDPRLGILPEVLPDDIAIALRRDGDRIVEFVAVAEEPVIRSVGP